MGKAIKILFVIGIIICSISLLKRNDEETTRVRVLANSNEVEDQTFKIEVTKALLVIIENKGELHFDFLTLKDIRNQLITKVGDKEPIQVEYKKVAFPAKSYQGNFLPSGNYWTLLVTIGEGKGKNWWSVLYPEYFGLSFEDRMGFEDVEYRSYIYDQWINKTEEDKDS